jgi:hypothetical protein
MISIQTSRGEVIVRSDAEDGMDSIYNDFCGQDLQDCIDCFSRFRQETGKTKDLINPVNPV